MKYCEKCKRIITDNCDVCDTCSNSLSDIAGGSIVTVATVNGRAISVLEPILKDAGVVCVFENTEGNIYNALNVKVSAESDYKVLVPFEMYHKAFDICLGMGYLEEDDRLVPCDNESEDENDKTYEEKFESVTGKKRGAWQMIWMIFFIIGACLVIWGIDWIAHLINPSLH